MCNRAGAMLQVACGQPGGRGMGGQADERILGRNPLVAVGGTCAQPAICQPPNRPCPQASSSCFSSCCPATRLYASPSPAGGSGACAKALAVCASACIHISVHFSPSLLLHASVACCVSIGDHRQVLPLPEFWFTASAPPCSQGLLDQSDEVSCSGARSGCRQHMPAHSTLLTT